MLHKIKVNERTLTAKPDSKLAAWISKNITETKEVGPEELAKMLTQPYGWTFTASYFTGERKKENFISQSIFYLDFDKGNTLEDIMNQLDMMSLRPNIIYNTLSDTIECRKFRVIFFLDGIIKCRDTAEWLQKNLVSLFPDSDSSVTTPERMIYGGWSVQHLDTEEISGEEFIKIINSGVVAADKKGTNFQTRGIRNFEILIDDSDQIEYRLIFDKVKHTQVGELPDVIQKFNWQKGFETIKILDAFDKGIRLKHMEIFGLATNLMYVKGGLQYMKRKMLEVNANPHRVDIDGKPAIKYISQQFATLPQVKKNKYLPNNLENFSPYKEDWEFTNILESTRWRKGRIDILRSEDKVTLEEAETLLQKEFKWKVTGESDDWNDIFNSDMTTNFENKVTIFKVPTGLGKTQQLETLRNALIATKTNALKRELSGRMKVEHCMTPDYPQFSDSDVNEMISSYTNSNLYEITSNLIEKISKGVAIELPNGKTFTPLAIDITLAADYRDDNLLCRTTTGTVITTHARVLFDTSFKHDTIIFDECPLDSIIEMGKYTIDFTAFDGSEWKPQVAPIEDWLRNTLGFNQIIETAHFVIPDFKRFQEFCALKGESSLIKLLRSDFVYRDNKTPGEIMFASNKPIPDKNIVIMSATAPIEIYKYVFGDKLEVIDISNVEKVGKIKQYTKKSWSRSSFLKASDKSKKDLVDMIGDKPVITFKNFKKMFQNPAPFYFGNTLGYDELKGQNIAVVGTDNKPLYVYFFYAKIIGLDLKTSDNLLDVRIVEWNGFKFKTMTFENEVLRNIQLSMIESELIQAVGRNRNLREKCETLLFSNQPLTISDEFIED